MLDELAERLRGNVDAAEKLAAAGSPTLAAAFEQHHAHATARHQVGDHQLQARQRRGAGEEWMPAVVHALLANVEQGQLIATGEELLQFLPVHRASRISACGGNTRQAFSSAL